MGAPLLALSPDTGLLHLGAREYDPETGAFTRRDPSGLEGGENQYAYAGGDPVNYWDPDGNFVAAVVVGAAAGAAIGGAEGAVFGAADEVMDQAFDPGRTGFDCGAIRAAAKRGAAAGAAAGAVAGGIGAAAGHLKWGNPKSKPTFGHTFEKHGAGPRNAGRLQGTARGTGTPQGQWTDDGAAAKFLESSRGGLSGPTAVPIPPGLGVVHTPGGATVPAGRAMLIPHPSGGYRTAFPIP